VRGHLEVCQRPDSAHINVAVQERGKVGQYVAVADHAVASSELQSIRAKGDRAHENESWAPRRWHCGSADSDTTGNLSREICHSVGVCEWVSECACVRACACACACACAFDVQKCLVFVSTTQDECIYFFMGAGPSHLERRSCPVVATLQSVSPKFSNSLPSWSTPVAEPPIPTPDPLWSAGKSFPPTGKAVQNSFCGCTAGQEK
jgi:hypothetical protein